jgi:hypothetical protein
MKRKKRKEKNEKQKMKSKKIKHEKKDLILFQKRIMVIDSSIPILFR